MTAAKTESLPTGAGAAAKTGPNRMLICREFKGL